jgi:hypothetical protein
MSQSVVYYMLISNNGVKNVLTATENLGNKDLFTSEFITLGPAHACEKPTKSEM